MRPAPVAAGFQRCRPGSVSRAANPGSSAKTRRDRLSAIPLAVTHFTNSRREVRIALPLISHDTTMARSRASSTEDGLSEAKPIIISPQDKGDGFRCAQPILRTAPRAAHMQCCYHAYKTRTVGGTSMRLLAIAAALASTLGTASAQDYPARPINIVVPAAA